MTFQQDTERNETKYLHRYADFVGKRVLEVGCGEGRLTWQYTKESRFTVGIDLDRDALRIAAIDKPSDLATKVHFSLAQSEQLPFSSHLFDLSIFAWSF